MTEPNKIFIACMDAEEAYLRKQRHRGAYAGEWHIVADKRDYRGLDWIYEARHPRIDKLIRGNKHEIVQDIISAELKLVS